MAAEFNMATAAPEHKFTTLLMYVYLSLIVSLVITEFEFGQYLEHQPTDFVLLCILAPGEIDTRGHGDPLVTCLMRLTSLLSDTILFTVL